ncbi:hypothetical protein V8F33_014015 [Rhypophila sp. PSN 637]
MTGKQTACERCTNLGRKCDKKLPTCGTCALENKECVPRYRQGKRCSQCLLMANDEVECVPQSRKRKRPLNDNTEGEGNPEAAARLEQISKELTQIAASIKKPRVNTDSTASSNTSPFTPTPAGQSNAALVSAPVSAPAGQSNATRVPSLALVRVDGQGKRYCYTFEYSINEFCAYLEAHSPEHIQLTWVGEQAPLGRFLSVIAEIGLLLQINLEWCSERGISTSEAKVPRLDLLNTIKSSKQYDLTFPGEVDGSDTACTYYWWSGNDGDGITLPQVFGGIEITWIRLADLQAFRQWHNIKTRTWG